MRSNEDHIFNPDSSPIRQIDAGFDCKNHSFLKQSLIFKIDHWVFVDGKGVRKTRINNSYYGVYLSTSSSNTLTNVTSSENSEYGIYIR